MGARCSMLVEAPCSKSEGRGFETPWDKLISSIYLIFPAALDPGVYSAPNRNGHQKQRQYFWGVERGRWAEATNLPPSVSRLSRPCGILKISQLYRPARPVMRISTEMGKYILCCCVLWANGLENGVREDILRGM
jgi:hypothetical protein